jgi:hypothetical protein
MDGLLGGRYDEGAMNRRVKDIVDTPEIVAAGTAAMAKPDTLDPLVWLAESRESSVSHVYAYEVLRPIKATMEEGGELPEIYFSESYLQQAAGLAQLRAAAAGKRLPAIWKEGFE